LLKKVQTAPQATASGKPLRHPQPCVFRQTVDPGWSEALERL